MFEWKIIINCPSWKRTEKVATTTNWLIGRPLSQPTTTEFLILRNAPVFSTNRRKSRLTFGDNAKASRITSMRFLDRFPDRRVSLPRDPVKCYRSPEPCQSRYYYFEHQKGPEPGSSPGETGRTSQVIKGSRNAGDV